MARVFDHITEAIQSRNVNENNQLQRIAANSLQPFTTIANAVTLPNSEFSFRFLGRNVALEVLLSFCFVLLAIRCWKKCNKKYYCKVSDHADTTSAIVYQPPVYLEDNQTTLERRFVINIPSEALERVQQQQNNLGDQRQKRTTANVTEPVRVVFLAHRSSFLFPSDEKVEWVS